MSKKGKLDRWTEVFFKYVDYNSDGQITLEEFKKILGKYPRLMEALMNPDKLI